MTIAWVATRIAEALGSGNVTFIAEDEQRAEAIAAAVRAAAPAAEVLLVPSSDALPGEDVPPSPANAGRRAAALGRLRRLPAADPDRAIALIASAEATARLYPPPAAFDATPPTITPGARIELVALGAELAELGYIADDRVDEPGELSVLGEVLDLFPADADLPVRIEVRGGTVTAIRAYDPMSQRSVAELDRIEIGRAAEPAIGEGVPLLAHIASGAFLLDGAVDERRKRFLALAKDVAAHGGRPARMVDAKAWKAALHGWTHRAVDDAPADDVPRFVERRQPLTAFAQWARAAIADGTRLIVAGGARDLRFLAARIAKALKADVTNVDSWETACALPAGAIATLAMPVQAGFRTEGIALIAAADLLGSRAMQDGDTIAGAAMPGGDAAIRIGDIVVHEDHGIALVAGLEAMPEGSGAEAIVLEHADGARRLTAIDGADRLWRYGADADAVTLDKLDGSSWQKRRGAIDIAIADSARGLAAIAEARGKLTAPVIEPDAAAYERFAAGFDFTETADQARAIAAVRTDLATGRPMDRLVIGDVGYGKTEVALRAAALVALAGGQVAVAAPTTVLVRQHLELFRARFEGTGITVAGLSRLSSAAEKKAVKAGLADGSIGIVIGTGAVAAKDVRYKRLDLVVIDEEQRFGAADKAKLRGEAGRHMLTLTATPIPRTLQTALVGLQQLSIIATPPARRQPIRTTVQPIEDTRVRTALIREKGRGGQSFVVVPRIENMAPFAARLKKLAPELAVIEAHGKMPAAALDEAMVGFAQGRGDVLLATNIIEAGLDVPRANTMIVWRADRFGLSQLHQLRGRVGRGGRRGQVLLLTDGEATIADATMKRLRTLQAFDRLGAGFAISARDLDMRGAGDLLGDAQAGHMKLIGVDLYQHLLGAALRQARGETIDIWSPELNLGAPGGLPPAWIPEEDVRIGLYVRLARAEGADAIDALEEEMEDRFGPLPPEAARLMALARTRRLARDAAIARVDAGPGAVALTPRRGFAADPAAQGLVEKGERWVLAERIEDDHGRLERVTGLLSALVDE